MHSYVMAPDLSMNFDMVVHIIHLQDTTIPEHLQHWLANYIKCYFTWSSEVKNKNPDKKVLSQSLLNLYISKNIMPLDDKKIILRWKWLHHYKKCRNIPNNYLPKLRYFFSFRIKIPIQIYATTATPRKLIASRIPRVNNSKVKSMN